MNEYVHLDGGRTCPVDSQFGPALPQLQCFQTGNGSVGFHHIRAGAIQYATRCRQAVANGVKQENAVGGIGIVGQGVDEQHVAGRNLCRYSFEYVLALLGKGAGEAYDGR